MTEAPLPELVQAIRNLHGCAASFLASVPVVETFEGKTVWQGAVVIFKLHGHATANRAYAWSTDVPGTDRRRFVAVLHAGPVDSPQAAVRASIVAEGRRDR